MPGQRIFACQTRGQEHRKRLRPTCQNCSYLLNDLPPPIVRRSNENDVATDAGGDIEEFREVVKSSSMSFDIANVPWETESKTGQCDRVEGPR